jgi:hypothetical protein
MSATPSRCSAPAWLIRARGDREKFSLLCYCGEWVIQIPLAAATARWAQRDCGMVSILQWRPGP